MSDAHKRLNQDAQDLLEELIHQICKEKGVPRSQLSDISVLAIAYALRPASAYSAELRAAYSAELRTRQTRSSDLSYELYDRHLKYIKHDVETFVQAKVEALRSGSFAGIRNTELSSNWPLHCSIRNVSTFQNILPSIVRTRKHLWDSLEPLGNHEAADWLLENDEPDGRAVVSIEIKTSQAAAETVVDALLDQSPLDQLYLEPLIGSEVVSYQPSVFEAFPVFEREPRTDEQGTWFPVRGLVQFVGSKTRELGITARALEVPCGGFREAVTLILTGIWMGKISLSSPQRRGRPLSVVQEFLMLCVLEERETGGKRRGEPGFYESIHSRWMSLRDRLLVHMAGHPRLKGIDSETTNSVKAVRSSLDRALVSVERVHGPILLDR